MTHDATPVTAAQIEQLLAAALDPIKRGMVVKDDLTGFATKEDLDRGIKSVNRGIDQVLDVLVNVDKRLTALGANHEVRIKRVEKKLGLAQIAA